MLFGAIWLLGGSVGLVVGAGLMFEEIQFRRHAVVVEGRVVSKEIHRGAKAEVTARLGRGKVLPSKYPDVSVAWATRGDGPFPRVSRTSRTDCVGPKRRCARGGPVGSGGSS